MIKPDVWQPADGLELEPSALRAVKEKKKSLALTAGPGAGKTEMLAQRADFLLRTGTCRYPKRILAISFKVDASKNLKERVRRRCGLDLGARFDSYTFHAFAKRVIDRFRPVLSGKDALDVGYGIGRDRIARKQVAFDDLIPLAIKIVSKSAVARNAIRQTYSDVFLDEFQDCTNQQYELIKILFAGLPAERSIRLIAVGDTKQKIMGWAGALDGIFLKFVKNFSAKPLNMYRNFRSKPRLLRMQNDIIAMLDPASVMPKDQMVGDEGEVFVWTFQDAEQEAVKIAKSISCWINNEGIPPSEIAVLLSKQPDLYAANVMDELQKLGIPYRNEQELQDLSAEPIARLIVDYLACLYGDHSPKAWVRLMDQLVPFGDDEPQLTTRQNLQRIISQARRKVKVAKSICDEFMGWWELAQEFLQEIGVETLTALSSDYEENDRLSSLIGETEGRIKELIETEPNLIAALDRFSDDQAVRILTIHKSKGLEFDSVIILGIEEQTFWGRIEEERCVFFVGVSRAKKRLVLTTSQHRETPSSKPYRWQEVRTAHKEFLRYAKHHLSNSSA